MNTHARFTVVLTACIDPSAGLSKPVRSDPLVRLNDYENGLRFWLQKKDPRLCRFVFLENSGYPLDSLHKIVRSVKVQDQRVEFLSLDNNYYPQGIGYGYAELQMIDEAFARSHLLQESTHFIKATGRLTFPSISRLLDRIGRHNLFSVDCRQNSLFKVPASPFVTTQLMLFSTEFYRRHLLNMKSELTIEMSHIEALIYKKLLPFQGRPGAMLRWPINVDPVGHAAHWPKKYHSRKRVAINFARAFSRMILPKWWI